VLGVAVGEKAEIPATRDSMAGAGRLADLPPGVGAAIHTLHDAGVRTVMITGDQSATAR
jgi:Ca2+-transporting ATPase